MSDLKEFILEEKKSLILFTISTIALIVGLIIKNDYVLLIPVALCGLPLVINPIKDAILRFNITASLLVTVGILGSLAIGEIEAAAEISIIMHIGEFLEEYTTNSASKEIKTYLNRQPKVVTIVENNTEKTIDIKEVKIGNVVRILPGETVPVDGKIVFGSTSVDQSMLTGEYLPKEVTIGNEVKSGTINMFGSIDVVAECVGNESTYSRMIKLLEETKPYNANIAKTADRWARYMMIISATVALIAYVLSKDIVRTVTVLVSFCPCAMILATPTAIMAATGNLSQRGIIIKNSSAIEKISKIKTVLFDKTGTLTKGEIICLGFKSNTMDSNLLLKMAASVEIHSEHPIGKAIVSSNKQQLMNVENFEYVPGKGVIGMIEGKQVVVGNLSLMKEKCKIELEKYEKLSEQEYENGFGVVFIGIDEKCVGYCPISDTIKNDSLETIEYLKEIGMETVMVTGDNKNVAKKVQSELKIDDVVWECMPEDKIRVVEQFENKNRTCMVGDGINDSASLKYATVGIGIGNVGEDLVIESSDIIVMNDRVSSITEIFKMSRKTIKTIKFGILLSLIFNIVAMSLGFLGVIGPALGAMIHNAGSIFVIGLAVLLMRFGANSVKN